MCEAPELFTVIANFGVPQRRRKAGAGGAIAPCLLILLKRGGGEGRLCPLKLILQINFF